MNSRKPQTFVEKERICEMNFLQEGPFWHLYTDGTVMHNVFNDETEFELGMNILVASACRNHEVQILAFELMSNHIHVILSGKKERCYEMFEHFKRRLRRVFVRTGRVVDWAMFNADMIPIDNLRSLRNEIVYVHRNAFVSHAQYTPYNYPWGSGIAYFNPSLKSLPVVPFDNLTYDDRRSFVHMRDVCGLARLSFYGTRVHVPSFCNINLGEAMFNDPRNYFNSLTRNAEAYSEIASRLKDSVFLTDDEMFAVASRYAMQEFNVKQLAMLNPEQKIQSAKELHFKYNATNQQLRRLLKLDTAILNEMFPNH